MTLNTQQVEKKETAKQACSEIAKLAIEEDFGDDTIMADWNGHTGSLSVQIFIGGWEPRKKPSRSENLFINFDEAQIFEIRDYIKNAGEMRHVFRPLIIPLLITLAIVSHHKRHEHTGTTTTTRRDRPEEPNHTSGAIGAEHQRSRPDSRPDEIQTAIRVE